MPHSRIPRLKPARAAALLSAAAFGLTLVCANPAAAESPVVIEGITDRALISDMRAILPEREPPENAFEAERLAEEAAERLSRWLRAEGFYAGSANAAPVAAPPKAVVMIDLGARYLFAPPQAPLPAEAPDELRDALDQALQRITPGAPARAAQVLAAELAAETALKAGGYPDAKALPRTATVDHSTQTMTVAFAFDLGAPAVLGPLAVAQEGFLSPAYLAKLQNWKNGDTYRPEALATLRRDLSRTGVFARVEANIAPADGARPRPVVLNLEPAPRRSISLGTAWSTTEGIGGEGAWSVRNRFKRADTLTFGATLAEREQRLDASLSLPHGAGRNRTRSYRAALLREDARPFERTGLEFAASVEADPNLAFALSYGASLTADAFTAAAGVENAVVLSGHLDARLDRADSRLDARNGFALAARIEPSLSTGDATVGFLRATGEARGYWSPGPQSAASPSRFTLAMRARAGWVTPIAGDDTDIPLDRRFYAGGGGSVRGFGFRAIFPETNRGRTDPPGGLGLAELSTEARVRLFDGVSVAGFIDGGAAFDNWTDVTPRWGAGLGLRYDLGFAPLRLDIATPLDRRPGDERVAIYLSLGQAF
jgi:translocation and assembly module TamA